jgi:hypothetical protein
MVNMNHAMICALIHLKIENDKNDLIYLKLMIFFIK